MTTLSLKCTSFYPFSIVLFLRVIVLGVLFNGVLSQCVHNEMCVSQCGMRCVEECGLQTDSNIGAYHMCRRSQVQCRIDPAASECRSSDCENISDEAHCFLNCEMECANEYLEQFQDRNACSDRCSSNCNQLAKKSGNNNNNFDNPDKDELDDLVYIESDEILDCEKFCSISSVCLGKDEMYEYNIQSGVAEVAFMNADGEPIDNWEYSSSVERHRIALALKDETSREYVKYQVYKDYVEDDQSFQTNEDMFSASDVFAALGLSEGMEDMTEDQMMALIQQMMMGGGMMGGYEEYGVEGYGYADGYGFGDMGGFGSAYDENNDNYEDDFDQ